ncbi:hypothetical protein BZA70DRAFT_265625 [Myxozyma melibiosi]|uniref:Uncharacterized protein n=1 Tax=Myxozyma melibiosi TaxID=54550 RepID=A0ABR1FET6_9ASCO
MSNSDIVSAVNTLIVAYTYKSGSVDWRLVGQELGVDKDCARMRVQRLIKKWPSSDMDVVHDKIAHSKLARPLAAAGATTSSSSASTSPTRMNPGGISKPRRDSIHYHTDRDHQIRINQSHSRGSSLGSIGHGALSTSVTAAYAPEAFAAQIASQTSGYQDAHNYEAQQAAPVYHRLAYDEYSGPTYVQTQSSVLPPPQPIHMQNTTNATPRGMLDNNSYLSASASMKSMNAPGPSQSYNSRSSSPSPISSYGRTNSSSSSNGHYGKHYQPYNRSTDEEADDSGDEGSVISAGAAEGAMMLEKMKIDTILV